MAVTLENFIKQIEDSGILAGDTLKDFITPKGSPKTPKTSPIWWQKWLKSRGKGKVGC